jgi:hypothetical protein
MENFETKRLKPTIEDFSVTVNSADIKELKPLRDKLHAYNKEDIEEYAIRSRQLQEWSKLLKKLNPNC